MSMAIYRANFVLMLIQSIINTVLNVVCVGFIYGSVTTIAGWTMNEMMVLIGTSLLVNQFFRSLILPNQNRFVADINNGSFDRKLLKPVDIVFQINTGTLDISSMLSSIAPIAIVFIYIGKLGGTLTIVKLLEYLLLVMCGVIILSCFMLLLHSLAFYFIKVDGLMNIYYIIMSISEKPREILPGKLLIGIFMYVIPAIPIAYIPAAILINKIPQRYILIDIGITLLLIVLSRLLVLTGVRKYSSASS